MEAVVALLAAGLGTLWWQWLRWSRSQRALVASLDPDVAIALHVAQHEARSREHQSLTAYHLLYGALQVEGIAEAIRATGGDAGTLEDRVLAALGQLSDEGMMMTEDAQRVLSFVYAIAHYHERLASAGDLWCALLRSRAAEVLAEGRVDGRRVLVRLVHRANEPEPGASGPDVLVVVRNDDHTTQAFVSHVLHDVFGLAPDAADALTLEVHEHGKGVVARLPAADARQKILEVRARAREHGFPLWIATEPA